MLATLRISLFGDFRLLVDEVPVTTMNVPRLQSLLAYLLLHRDAPQDRSHLAFLFWPDSTEVQAHTNLRKLLYQLRQAFPAVEQFLQIDKQSLQWLQPREDVSLVLDLQEIEQAHSSAVQAEQAQDTRALQQALALMMQLYHGDLLPTCYDEWILPERDRWSQLFLQAGERQLTLLEEARDYESAITVAQQLLRYDALHEVTYLRLMRLQALRGDRAAALRVYHTCVTLLERELGTEPGEAMREAYESLLQSDSPAKIVGAAPTSRGTAPPLLGRNAEWRQLQELWRKVTNGSSHCVMLTGEAGIGKTRLAEEMEAWVSRQGMATASARCYSAFGRLAYAPVTAWLRAEALQANVSALDPIWLTEISRLAPEILTRRQKLSRPTPMTEGWQRQHFFAALAHAVLSARQPLLLLLDDLQWCDNETLEWVYYLLRFDPQARLLLIGTVRAEETLNGHPLLTFLSMLQRDNLVTEVPLGALTALEVTSLAEHIMSCQLDPALSNTLYRETEGNPLFVVELARSGTLGAPAKEAPGARNTLPLLTPPAANLPPAARSVVAARLAQLSSLARDVANVAAVIGREFTFSVLAQASSENEYAVVQGLDELWQRRIVREQSSGVAETYDFSHDKLREHVYATLSHAHQRLLHRRVAEALEVIYAENLESMCGQIAFHYERAGIAARAITYYQRAGEQSRQIFANAEAIEALQRAIALFAAVTEGHSLQGRQWETLATLSLLLGNIFALTGRQLEARDVYQHGSAAVPEQEYIWRARLLRKMAATWNMVSHNPLDTFHANACQVFQEAALLLECVEDKASDFWRNEWIDLHIDQLLPLRGSVEEMTALISKVSPMVNQYGTAEQRGQLFQAIGAYDGKRSRFVATDETVRYRREVLASVQLTGNKGLIGFSHFSLGNQLLWAGYVDEARQAMQAAITIAEQTGNSRLLARCLLFLPCVLRRQNKVEDVRALLARAQTVPETRYTALFKGHQAWIEWRDGDLAQAEVYGRISLEEEQNPIINGNPFKWVGAWPLIGVALARGQVNEAIGLVHVLFGPEQQLPPAQIKALLEAALQRWDAGMEEEALALLQQAVPHACELGYL